MKYNAKPAYQRHDMSDDVWNRIASLLLGQKGKRGKPSDDNRKFVNAVFWILRTRAPWRDLPPSYGNWNSVAKRFRRWVVNGQQCITLVEPILQNVIHAKRAAFRDLSTIFGDSSPKVIAKLCETGYAPLPMAFGRGYLKSLLMTESMNGS